TGQRLWGDTGMEVTSNSPISQEGPKISFVDGAFYIGWSGTVQIGTNYIYQTYGQKIQNNTKMWGPDGILISDIGTVPGLSECILADLNGLYFVWQRSNSVGDPKAIYAKRMQADGTAFPGWDAAGKAVTTYSNYDTIQLHPKSILTDQGLFVTWRDMREDFLLNYWGQLFSPSGDRLWNTLGVNLADAAQEQEFAALSYDHNGVNMVWAENINGMHDIKYSKFSYAGSPLWNPLGNFMVQADSTQIYPAMAKFQNRGNAVAWADYFHGESDIYYKYLNTDGSLVGPPMGNPLTVASKFQYNPLLAAVGNEAYAIWADGRSSGKTEILGLYMQKMNNQCSGIDDPAAPSLSVYELKQNYPNPFNPETTIQLSVKEAGTTLELGIYNLKGQLVKRLHQGHLAKGEHSFVWNGTDNNNSGVASGVYYYKVSSNAGDQVRKMLLVK
ncbi:MAG TPA: FlgD immunoglobulin-like domain containing protein, partial [Candidatus Cloacimonadota bacterium]|nr:FlgD immunoglobulin-like domain containing protein [Candidatus Cloacimonadota bacterium]